MSEARKYTARDIEKYHKGQLSPAEMNALEKAALDDPFLAESIEGYNMTAVNQADLDDLKQRLSKRTGLKSTKRGSIVNLPWLRVAAMIVFIAGAGLLVYQFGFNKSKNNELVKLEDRSTPMVTTDSSGAVSNLSGATKQDKETGKKEDEPKEGSFRITTTNNGKTGAKVSTPVKEDAIKAEYNAVVTADDAKPDAKIASPASEKNEQKSIPLAKQDEVRKAEERYANNKKDLERADVTGLGVKRSGPSRQLLANNFRGRVTDPNNNPVPFASITNTRDKDATYSDANGYFNLNSADTVLDVQVSSVGFEVNNARLSDVKENKVILRDDPNPLSEVVISSQKANTTRRSQVEKKKTAEPEPRDGWEKYDVYLINNLQLPDEIKTGNIYGQVELSFEINKSGTPINIRIEKSLCRKCDEEAIRLIKQGPKWMSPGKKARAIVSVPFTNYRQ